MALGAYNALRGAHKVVYADNCRWLHAARQPHGTRAERLGITPSWSGPTWLRLLGSVARQLCERSRRSMSEHELKSSAISDMRLCDAFSVCSEPSEPIAAGKHSRLLCETLRCSRWPSAAVISEKPSSVSA